MKNSNIKVKKEDVVDTVNKVARGVGKAAHLGFKALGAVPGTVAGAIDAVKKGYKGARKTVGGESKNLVKEHTINFIKYVNSKDYKKANEALAAIVNEKLKQRIQAANAQLENKSK